jgi:hypothetical protein
VARTPVRHARNAAIVPDSPLGTLVDPGPPTNASLRIGAVPTPPGDLTRWPWLAAWLRTPSWQFQVTLPNQVLFWVVIVVGLVGPSDPRLNFATTITWFVWFCLVFVLIVTTGRGWCAMCPFGGLAEWVQRRALWHRRTRPTPTGAWTIG